MFRNTRNCINWGVILYVSTLFSCTPAHESKWAMDLLLQEEFVIYHSVVSIPKPLIDEISSPDDVIAIAEPDEVFKETNELVNDLSPRRLIFAGQSGKHWFVYYEQGEWRRTDNILALFELTNIQVIPKIKLRFSYSNKVQDFTLLKDLIILNREMTFKSS